MGHSCLILAGQYFTEGYFPQRVLRQFHHIQHYTSPGEAIDRRAIFPLRWHSSALLVNASLSWKGKNSSSHEGLFKQDRPTTTSNCNSWWEHYVANQLLLLRIPCFLEKTMAPPQINESNPMRTYLTSAWKRLKSNWLDGWPSLRNSTRRMLSRSRRLNSQIFSFSYFF
ncbi:hypothetical protein AMTRI_Chr08g163940 [Amborella trichopoda]